jgi:hypothetical protein
MSLLDRLRDLLGRGGTPALTVDTPDLAVVAGSFDPAAADSAVLAQDGWELREIPDSGGAGKVRLHALRVQFLDPLHCAQERSRMTGLAQRLGGESLGWDALQPRS